MKEMGFHDSEDVGKGGYLFIGGGNVNLYSHYGISVAVPQEVGNISTLRSRCTSFGHLPK